MLIYGPSWNEPCIQPEWTRTLLNTHITINEQVMIADWNSGCAKWQELIFNIQSNAESETLSLSLSHTRLSLSVSVCLSVSYSSAFKAMVSYLDQMSIFYQYL